MIRYTEAFKENVQGTLQARFQLDENGKPGTGEEDGTRFYFIRLTVASPKANRIAKVTYLLDQASYWEPERESTAAEHAFAEEITSYGDFLVRVEIKMHSGERFVQQALLSDMLETGHADDCNEDIARAIETIRRN